MMGQLIDSPEEGKLRVRLICDHEGQLFRAEWLHVSIFRYDEIMALARSEGWRRTAGGKWKGPCCP